MIELSDSDELRNVDSSSGVVPCCFVSIRWYCSLGCLGAAPPGFILGEVAPRGVTFGDLSESDILESIRLTEQQKELSYMHVLGTRRRARAESSHDVREKDSSLVGPVPRREKGKDDE